MPALTSVLAQGTHAARPAASSTNASWLYYATDTGILWQSTGAAWTQIAASSGLDILSAKGDLLTRSGSAYARLGVGSNDQVLTADSAQSSGLKWAAPPGFANPMSAQDDLIVGGASGAPGRLAKGSDGQVLTVDPTTHHLVWATPSGGFASSGALTQIAASVLGSSAANITFSSIPGTYSSLQIVLQARGDTSATQISLAMQLNGDTGSNYDDDFIQGQSTTVVGANHIAQTSALVGIITAGTAPAGAASALVLFLPNYAGTTFRKQWVAQSMNKQADSSTNVNLFAHIGEWRSTAAVTSITLFPTSGNFAAGTSCQLYGLL